MKGYFDMEYINVINWVYDAFFEVQKPVRYEMKKHMFKIGLSNDKEKIIKELILQLDYETSLAGFAYISSGYKIGPTLIDVRDRLTKYYMNTRLLDDIRDKEKFIREDAQRFYEVYLQDMKLRDMLSQSHENVSTEKENEHKQKEREINEDGLRECFRITFRGAGNGNIDYFTNNLLPDLKRNWNDKDFAKIALMIYNSGELTSAMRPNTFKEWYQGFCKLVGCGFHEYKPNALIPNDRLKKAFYYLQR